MAKELEHRCSMAMGFDSLLPDEQLEGSVTWNNIGSRQQPMIKEESNNMVSEGHCFAYAGCLSASRTAGKCRETAIRQYAAVESASRAALECCSLPVVVAAESECRGACGPIIPGQEIDVQADMRARPQGSGAHSTPFAAIPT